jgi:hypothetical protein
MSHYRAERPNPDPAPWNRSDGTNMPKQTIQTDKALELVFEDLHHHIATSVGSAVMELANDASSLRGLAKSLEDLSAFPTGKDHDELRETAARIKATGMQAVAVALGVLAISEQVQAYAAVRLVAGYSE